LWRSGWDPRTRQQDPERSSSETREFLDAKLRDIDLKCRSQFHRVRSPYDRHTYQQA